MKYKLKIIVGSTRPTRKGPIVAEWFVKMAEQHPDFEIELLDLKEINLPIMDEPNHPGARNYTKEYTKKWSKTIDEADAFVFVTPEYNFCAPATFKNAMDYLFQEWQEKPVGLVSYGGMSGGMRAAQDLKAPITTLGMMPLPQGVAIPFFTDYINDDNVFEGKESLEKSANVMLTKLLDWAKALKGMREGKTE